MTSHSTLDDPRVKSTLDHMFAQAERDDTDTWQAAAHRPPGSEPTTAQERADLAAGLYLPISAEGGRLLYTLIRAVRPRTVVEFGMSFGISTLHLAAAVRDNGLGRVITTELSASKIATARQTFAETGLDDVITILEGDACETLPAHLDAGVDFVLLDGWKYLYLPVLHLLEPHLAPGTLVIADDVEMKIVQPYLAYIRDPENGYQGVTFTVEDGMEVSCRL
jgi:predicted O-methyltransferase YrrM